MLHDLVILLDLAIINHPGIATFETGASLSVLDLTFVRPAQIKNLRKWKILEEEPLSGHRYICFEFKSRKLNPPQNLDKGSATKKLDKKLRIYCKQQRRIMRARKRNGTDQEETAEDYKRRKALRDAIKQRKKQY